MEELKPCPILKFNKNQLNDVRKEFNYAEGNKLKQDLDQFEDWIRKQNHFTVREFPREYLERYLINNKGSLERAKKRFDQLLTIRGLIPEMTTNFDVKNEFHELFNVVNMVLLPKPSRDNYRIAFQKIHKKDFTETTVLSMYRYFQLLIDYAVHHDYAAGYEYVVDARELSLGMMAKINPFLIHKAMSIVNAYGFRLRCLHYISASKVLDTLVVIVKQGLTEKLRNRIKVHTSFESFFETEDLPKALFPSDYGGNEATTQELSDLTFKELCSEENIRNINFLDTAHTDESCRLSREFNQEYSGMPGSFKKLVVD